jgi:putative tricarboxylic transport membrane protein
MNRYDKISGFVWLVVSLGIIASTWQYPFGTLGKPGTGFVPLLSGVIMTGLSLGIILQAVFRAKEGEKEKGKSSFLNDRWPKLVVTLIILFSYAFLLDILGFVLATFALVLFLLKIVEPTKWHSALLQAVVTTGACYLLFYIVLKVPMPRGIWERFF